MTTSLHDLAVASDLPIARAVDGVLDTGEALCATQATWKRRSATSGAWRASASAATSTPSPAGP